jgi:hypothetical protein
MDAISVPLIDHMILLKHPRIAFVSANPMGNVLAERFMSVLLRERGYQRGIQFVNLGYLPGGIAGVQAFARNPVKSISQADVWTTPVLADVQSLGQFAAIVVLTDDADTGRVWIEQTSLMRGTTPILVGASAQAAPMLYPYYHSGQVAGMINGLHGASVAEQRNAGLPGTARRYWDAYALSMWLSVAAIGIGGLWNFFLGMAARRREDQ